MKARTDPHRPSVIIPTDYEYVCSYSRPCASDRRGYMQELSELAKRVHDLPRAGKCGCCGAHFMHGDVWRHVTGTYIHLGHQCAAKYQMLADRSEWEAWHRAETKRRSIAIKEHKRATARELEARMRAEQRAAFLALPANAGLAIDIAPAHDILQDLDAKLTRWGSLTEKQVAFARRLAAEVRNPKAAEQHVPAPEGRVTFTGTIVSIKEHEGDWGICQKMTVKIETPEGSWLTWLTMPRDLVAQRGDVVTLTATITRSDREPYFAFGKRPKLVNVVEAVAS